MKVAVISSGNPHNLKGVMNFVWEKVRRLSQLEGIDVDYYIVRTTSSYLNSILLRIFKKGSQVSSAIRINQENINGLNINYLWFTRTILDQFVLKFVNRSPIPQRVLRRFEKTFEKYDILVSHTPDTHIIGLHNHQKSGKPYITTWHGSDINVLPYEDRKILPLLKNYIENASVNYFVSKYLLEKSNYITPKGNKAVYYTGPSESFRRFSEDERASIRARHNCSDKKVVAFVGSIIPVKNVEVLPGIFSRTKQAYTENIEFWVIGIGHKEDELINQLNLNDVPYKMFGNINPVQMPELMNCIDVLVLPSKNEGLGLVLLEAIKCGAYAVGSNIGGIPEVAGKENVFDLDENFADNISSRIVYLLTHPEYKQSYDSVFSWKNSILSEVEVYKSIVHDHI